jgi:hypothetical protein
MRKPTRNVIVVLSGIVLFLSVIALCGVIHAHIQRIRTERFLAVLSQIRVGLTDDATAVRLTERYPRQWTESSNGGQKQLGFYFDNRGMYLLRLAPYTEFRASITFKDGLVVRKNAGVGVGDYAGGLPGIGWFAWVTESVRGFGFADDVAPKEYPNHIVRGGAARDTTIDDDNTYPEAERHRDWAFNLACLTRLGGCPDSRLLLPNAVPTTQ